MKPWAVGGEVIIGGGGGAGVLHAVGRIYTDEYLSGGFASAGTACSQNGLHGRDGSGPLFCQDGVWQSSVEQAGALCGGVNIDGYTGQPISGTAYVACHGRAFITAGCPDGYYLATPFAATAQWFYTCVKS